MNITRRDVFWCKLEEYKELCKNKKLTIKIGDETPLHITLKKKPIILDISNDRVQVEICSNDINECSVVDIMRMATWDQMKISDINREIKEVILGKLPNNVKDLEVFLEEHGLLTEDVKELLLRKKEIINKRKACIELYMG